MTYSVNVGRKKRKFLKGYFSNVAGHSVTFVLLYSTLRELNYFCVTVQFYVVNNNDGAFPQRRKVGSWSSVSFEPSCQSKTKNTLYMILCITEVSSYTTTTSGAIQLGITKSTPGLMLPLLANWVQ